MICNEWGDPKLWASKHRASTGWSGTLVAFRYRGQFSPYHNAFAKSGAWVGKLSVTRTLQIVGRLGSTISSGHHLALGR